MTVAIGDLNEITLTRFWSRVERRDLFGCWLWTAVKDGNGYGEISVGGKMLRTHRVAYELAVGPIPKGLCVLHTCDNPPCVNPAHLWLGTKGDNTRDCIAKGRGARSKGEAHGLAKLKSKDIPKIRNDDRALRTIAADYGVGRNTICDIKRRKRWIHIK